MTDPPFPTTDPFPEIAALLSVGYLEPELIAEYADAADVPAAATAAAAKNAHEAGQALAAAPRPPAPDAWPGVRDLFLTAHALAAQCEEFVVSSDPEHTAELERVWQSVQEELLHAANHANAQAAYWAGWHAGAAGPASPNSPE